MDDSEVIELLGALQQDPILGARVPAKRGGTMAARQALVSALVPRTPGVPKPGAREFPLGFTPIQFGAATALTQNLVARPQRPHKGTRLVLDIVRSAAGSGGLITVSSFFVGQNNQLQSAQPIIAQAFVSDSTYVMLNLDPAVPGIDIVVGITLSAAPGAGETVDVGGALWGIAIG
jgi:hypothetical protein